MTDFDSPPLLNDPPPARRRTLINVAVAIFLFSQVAIPISYYLGDEVTSERFAWRMFSTVDLSTWETTVTAMVEESGQIVERPVPLSATLQESHVKGVQQAQLDIVEPLLRRLLQEPGVQEVRFEARGTAPSGKAMPPIRYSMKPGGPLVRQAS